jgi:molybdate transport system substrate-binding protein
MENVSVVATRNRTVRLFFMSLTLAFSLLPRSDAKESVSIAAAADLQYCLVDLNKAFAEENPGLDLKVSTGSSGNFSTQIKNGAPFDVFLSADSFYPDDLVKSGNADLSTRLTYAYGKIALWTKHPERIDVQAGLDILKQEQVIHRIAIANPDHAPYGRAAKAALEKAGLWESVQDRLVFGENIAQTAQFVDSENADVGIVALSLILSPALKGTGAYSEIDPSLYPPLQQVAICTKQGSANAAARNYVRFLNSSKARTIFDRYGFTLGKPNDSNQ